MSPAVLLHSQARSSYAAPERGIHTSWNFACAVSSPGFLSVSESVPKPRNEVVALCTRVQFDRKLAIGLFDFKLRRSRWYAKGVVVCRFYDHDCEFESGGVGGEWSRGNMSWARVGRLGTWTWPPAKITAPPQPTSPALGLYAQPVPLTTTTPDSQTSMGDKPHQRIRLYTTVRTHIMGRQTENLGAHALSSSPT
jgi:hypothetical protein